MIDGARVRSKTYTVDSREHSTTKNIPKVQEDPTKPVATKQPPPPAPPIATTPPPPAAPEPKRGVVPTPSTAKLLTRRKRATR